MPKEQIRKRGRRKPKHEAELPVGAESPPPQPEQAGPSGLHPSRAALISGHRPPPLPSAVTREPEEEHTLEWQRAPRTDSEYPFGVLDPDSKAYFRNVEDRIRDWEGALSTGEGREGLHDSLEKISSQS